MTEHETGRGVQTLILCWAAFFSIHFARMNWATLMPFGEKALSLSKTMSGLIMSGAFLSYAVMQIPAGSIADRTKNRRLIGIALIATGVITCLTGLADTFSGILLLRVLTGFAASFVFTPSLRLLSLALKRTEKGKAIGVFFTAPTASPILLGIIIPPLAENLGWQWGFFISGIPSIITGLAVLILAQEATDWKKERSPNVSPLKDSVWTVFSRRSLLLSFLASFFAIFTLSGAKIWTLDYLITDLRTTGVLAGIIYSVFNLMMILNKPISGWVSDTARRRIPTICCSLILTSLVCFLIAPKTEMLISIALILCLGAIVGFQIPASTALITEIASTSTVGMAISTQNMMGMMGYAVQPLLTGYMLDLTDTYAWVWIICAIAAAVAAVLYAFVKE